MVTSLASVTLNASSGSVFGREQTEQLFGLPYPLTTFVVQMQYFNRRSPDGRRSDDRVLVPLEVVRPRVLTRIEQSNRL